MERQRGCSGECVAVIAPYAPLGILLLLGALHIPPCAADSLIAGVFRCDDASHAAGFCQRTSHPAVAVFLQLRPASCQMPVPHDAVVMATDCCRVPCRGVAAHRQQRDRRHHSHRRRHWPPGPTSTYARRWALHGRHHALCCHMVLSCCRAVVLSCCRAVLCCRELLRAGTCRATLSVVMRPFRSVRVLLGSFFADAVVQARRNGPRRPYVLDVSDLVAAVKPGSTRFGSAGVS